MKRILHVKHTLGYDGATIIEYRIAKLLEGKMVFDWMLTGLPEWVDQGYADRFTNLGSKIFFGKPFLPPFSNWKWNELAEVWHYYRVFKKLKYDVVYCDTDNPERVKLLLGAKLAGVKRRVLHSHNSQREGGNVPPKRLAVYKWLMKYVVTDCLACSSLAAQWMFPIATMPHVKIIKDGLDIDKYKFNNDVRYKVRNKLNLADDVFVIGFVGRFVEQKNCFRLITIFKKLFEKNDNSTLLMIGNGPTKTECKCLVKNLELPADCVIFIDNTDNVEDYYNAMDIFLLPSLHEGLSMTSVEAQVSGLNCVLSKEVPDEANVSGNCKFVALSSDDNVWADICLSMRTKTEERLLQVQKVREAGYEIKNTAEMVYELFKD